MRDPSELARAGLRFLFLGYPMRTSIGLCGGITVSMLLDAFKNAIPPVVNVAAFTDIRMAIAGAFLVHLPQIFWKRRLPERIEAMFDTVRIAVKEGEMSEFQIRQLYIKLCHDAASQTSLGTPEGHIDRQGGHARGDAAT